MCGGTYQDKLTICAIHHSEYVRRCSVIKATKFIRILVNEMPLLHLIRVRKIHLKSRTILLIIYEQTALTVRFTDLLVVAYERLSVSDRQ